MDCIGLMITAILAANLVGDAIRMQSLFYIRKGRRICDRMEPA